MFEQPKNLNIDCSICFESININKKVTTICNHNFCNDCFFKWISTNSSCPTCRKEFVKPPKAEEIKKQKEILSQLIFRERQICEYIRLKTIEYTKKEANIKHLNEQRDLINKTVLMQNNKLETLCKEWIQKKKKFTHEREKLE